MDDKILYNELSYFHRYIVSRTLNALRRNNITLAGEVRKLDVGDLITFRDMGDIKANIAIRMYAPLEEKSNP